MKDYSISDLVKIDYSFKPLLS